MCVCVCFQGGIREREIVNPNYFIANALCLFGFNEISHDKYAIVFVGWYYVIYGKEDKLIN